MDAYDEARKHILNAGMDNVLASKLGDIASKAGDPGLKCGDRIDRGLILARLLRDAGFGLVCIPTKRMEPNDPR